ncbi:Leucine-rich repeat-containing protein 3 [Argiope bruennichi]|uniref:Leucine-rich repeat-containing protein 3 n=1 Tax=Argiope bruennichi TaxID=94029 RepID=A0A8T0F035_ARGBR|nr:Leucine-rich repeat-containing protein 3 [Argiope bruennichi]
MEIVDTPLSSKFACGKSTICKNTITKRLTAVNSTSFEEADSLCPTGKGDFYPWTNCMHNLTYFHFSHGKLTSFDKLFLLPMENLIELNLTHNRITKIESAAMKNLPNLSILDLSHNVIEHLDGVFGKEIRMNLVFLDVSWNFIKTIGDFSFHRYHV